MRNPIPRILLSLAARVALLTLGLYAAPEKALGQIFGGNDEDSKAVQIDGDTIKVAPNKSSMLSFIGPFIDFNILDDDYLPSASGSMLIVKCKNQNPAEKFAQMIVSEGPQSAPRQHTFIIQDVRTMSLQEQRHDYSSIEKIRERMAYLEQAKKTTPIMTASASRNNSADVPAAPVAPRVNNVRKSDVPTSAPPPTPARTAGENIYIADGGEATKNVTDEAIRSIPPDQLKKRVDVTIQAFYQACQQLIRGVNVPGAIVYGMKLFNNDETVLVERTNSRTGKRSSDKIRKYFRSLSQLNYSRVDMTAADINFISGKLVKGADGKYHGTAVILQDFKGFRDNVIAYQDQTKKVFDIIIEVKEVMKDGEMVDVLQVFLGNISVNDEN